jgi:catechol 2,3-dioxygenase-like lactoylglutathione lyase family enzyme
MEPTNKLFGNARPGSLTRRQLLEGIAVAAAAAAMPRSAFALPAFKPIWLNHYTYTAPDMQKTVDWYIEVFAMQKGMSNARETHLWYGDTGGDTLMIVRQAQAGDVAPGITRFGFTIDHFDRNTVGAALRERGLNPQADTDKGFWFKDPEGNEIGVFAKDWMARPSGSGPRPTTWKALSANHIVLTSPDYKTLANWYLDLFGFYQTTDNGRDVYQWFGDTVWIPTAVGQDERPSSVLRTLDHVAYTIENSQTRPVGVELKRRKMIPETSTAENGNSLGINCVDVNNFKTQICAWNLVINADRGTRLTGGNRGGGAPRGQQPGTRGRP